MVAGFSQSKDGISNLSEVRYLSNTPTTVVNKLNTTNSKLQQDASTTMGISIYPNPATDYVHVKAVWSANERVSVRIYNEEGKTLFSNTYFMQNGNELLTIPVNSNWKAGNYYIIATGNKTQKGSFTIIK